MRHARHDRIGMHPAGITAFGLWLIGVVAFILVTGGALPETPASHFGAAGRADGFMPRAGYLAVMCLAGGVLPAAIVLLQHWIVQRSPQRLKLPRRDYWLTPERRAETFRSLAHRLMVFGVGLSALIAFVHWEVVQANLRTPPQLDNERFIAALAVFIVATAVWVYRLHVRFRSF